MNIEEIWTEYRSNLMAFIRSRVANSSDAEDLLQEIMIKTHDGLSSVKNQASIKSWVFQIAHNTIIDFYRNTGRGKNLPADELWYGEEDTTVQQELTRCIEPFIRALPADTAEIIRQIDINGVSQKDYAQQHGIAYSTLKSRVQKGRSDLRVLFDKCCSFTLDATGSIAEYSEKSGGCKNC